MSEASSANSFYNQSNHPASEVTEEKEQKLQGGAHLTSTIAGTKSNLQEPKPTTLVKTSLAGPSSVKENVFNAISNYDKSMELGCIFEQRKFHIGPASRVSQDVAGRNQPESLVLANPPSYPPRSKEPSSQNNQGSLGQQSIGLINSKEQRANPNEPTTEYTN